MGHAETIVTTCPVTGAGAGRRGSVSAKSAAKQRGSGTTRPAILRVCMAHKSHGSAPGKTEFTAAIQRYGSE